MASGQVFEPLSLILRFSFEQEIRMDSRLGGVGRGWRGWGVFPGAKPKQVEEVQPGPALLPAPRERNGRQCGNLDMRKKKRCSCVCSVRPSHFQEFLCNEVYCKTVCKEGENRNSPNLHQGGMCAPPPSSISAPPAHSHPAASRSGL